MFSGQEELSRIALRTIISAFWDVLPTLSVITGVEVPEYVDGVLFLPTLLGSTENQETHDYWYWEFQEMGGKQALRIGNWKAFIIK